MEAELAELSTRIIAHMESVWHTVNDGHPLRINPVVTRAQIARATGAKPGTVTRCVGMMIYQKLLRAYPNGVALMETPTRAEVAR